MNWYYADNGKQAGPVDDAQFEALIQSGKITGDTLIWHEELTNWQPLRTIRPMGAVPPPIAPPLSPPGFAQPSPLAGTQRFAGFWIRLVAKFIDGMIVGVILGIPSLAFFFGALGQAMHGGFRPDSPEFQAFIGILQLGGLLVGFLYDGICVAKWGATPGKMALQLRVISADGSAVSTQRAFGRAAAQILSKLACSLGYLIAAFDSEKRALHDHMAGTRVVFKQ